MSDRDIDINLSNSTDKSLDQAPTPEEIKEFKARMARVYERGIIVDRLHVDLPPTVHGEWVSRDQAEIARMELLGFHIDDKYAVNRKLNDSGDGSAIVGDVVHMIQPKWMHEILEQRRMDVYRDTHMKKQQKEEKDFVAQQASIGESDNTKVASTAEVLPGHELTARLTNQT